MDSEAPSAPWEGGSATIRLVWMQACVGCVFGGAPCVVGTRLSALDAGACWAVGSRRGTDSGGHGRDPGEWNPRRVMTDATSQMLHLGVRAEGVVVVL